MRSFVQLFIALLTLAALAWVVGQGYSLLRTEQSGLDAYTQSVVIIAAIILIVCTFVLNAAIRGSGQTVAQARLLPRKLELYESFVLIWHTLTDEADPALAENLELKLTEVRVCLALQASQPVQQAINELTDAAQDEGRSGPATQAAFDKLLLAMRADLGQLNSLMLKKDVQKLVSK